MSLVYTQMTYKTLASKVALAKTIEALENKGYAVEVVANSPEALKTIMGLIPMGASVMNGASRTLDQVGYMDFLKQGKHEWVDLHARINSENDEEKRAKLRRESVLSDYYLGSVHALVENGEFIVATNTGSQLPHIVGTSPNLVFVVSTKKIVPTMEEAMNRLNELVVPLEDERMQKAYKMGTMVNKILIFKGEAPMMGRKITFVLVEEDLGF